MECMKDFAGARRLMQSFWRSIGVSKSASLVAESRHGIYARRAPGR